VESTAEADGKPRAASAAESRVVCEYGGLSVVSWIGYLAAAALVLVWAARHPHLATFITLAVLVVVGWWVSHGTRAPSTGFGSHIIALAGGRCGTWRHAIDRNWPMTRSGAKNGH
jgi:hypothetical protein